MCRGKNVAAPLRIGLTGGIASGKSTVADYFAELGAVIIDADIVARDLVAPGQPLLATLANEFGDAILTDSGELDRAALRERVFKSGAERKRLEALLHPAILENMALAARAATGDYVIMVIPLLAETGAKDLVDRVLVVDCEPSLQLARLQRRDGTDDVLGRQMLAAQASREQRLELADDVLVNDRSPEDLARMVEKLDGFYRELAKASDRETRPGLRLP